MQQIEDTPVVVLTMDIATRTGWAVNRPGGNTAMGGVVCGAVKMGPRTKVGLAGMGREFGTLFKELREKYGPTHFAYEMPFIPHGQNVQTAEVLFGLAMMAETLASMRGLLPAWTDKRGAPSYRVHNQAIFARFTGGGRMKRDQKKALTIDTCRAYGMDVGTDDDKADACAVNVVCRWQMGDPSMPAGPMFVANLRA